MPQRILRLRRRARAAVVGLSVTAVVAVALAGWLLVESLIATRMERRAEAAALADRQTVRAANALLQAATDAETGERGFLLTRRGEFLQPYSTAGRRADEALDRLGSLAPGDPVVRRTTDLAHLRLGLIATTIDLARAGRRAEAIAVIDRGRSVMDQLRVQVQALLVRAEAHSDGLRARRSRFVHRTEALQAGQALATLLALGVALSALLVERLTASIAAELQGALTAETEVGRRAAEEADRAKSRFLAAASHDMRQPLHALALYISALERRVEGPQAREILANMDGAVRAMTRLFTALLDMARLEAGVLKPEPLDFSICDLLHEVAEHSLDLRGRRQVQVVVVPTTLQVHTDPDLLEIVLRNLASNAVKHSKGGRVLLGCRRMGSAVKIEVRDDGEGIASDKLQQLFAEFVRGEGAHGTEGVGLGLSIVQRLTKLLGHPLSVRSEVGRGSVFAVTVPRAAPAAAREPPARPPAADALRSATGGALQGARILVADDEPLALDAMSRALRDAGAEVATAPSTVAAEALAAEGWALQIFDLNLGDDDGLELIRRIEARRGAPTRALIVTGTTTPEALARLRGSGRPWLTKPLSADELVAAASRLLASSTSVS